MRSGRYFLSPLKYRTVSLGLPEASHLAAWSLNDFGGHLADDPQLCGLGRRFDPESRRKPPTLPIRTIIAALSRSQIASSMAANAMPIK